MTVNPSKVRNCFGEAWKEKYQDLRMTPNTVEGQPISASVNFLAVTWDSGSGSGVGVVSNDDVGVRRPTTTMFRGHKGTVHDIEFSPIYSSIFATASEDTTVKVWEILPEGAVTTKQDSIATLAGHDKKVLFSTWNPVTDWIIASGSADATVKVWNVEEEKNVFSARHPQAVTHVAWNSSGSLLASTCRDKQIRILDPRHESTSGEIEGHQGNKPAKCCWLDGPKGDPHFLVSCGTAKGAAREAAVWDARKFTEPIFREVLDRGTGAIIPFWDGGSGILFLAGKGDGNIRQAEVRETALNFLTEYRCGTPCKATAFLPKRGVDVMRNEMARAFRIEGQNNIQPVSFCVPRRATEFQEDLFPDCFAGEVAVPVDKWLQGENAEPILGSMVPDAEGKTKFVTKKRAAAAKKETPVNNSPAVLKRKLTAAETQLHDLVEDSKGKDETNSALVSKNDELANVVTTRDETIKQLNATISEKSEALKSSEEKLAIANKELERTQKEMKVLQARIAELEETFNLARKVIYFSKA